MERQAWQVGTQIELRLRPSSSPQLGQKISPLGRDLPKREDPCCTATESVQQRKPPLPQQKEDHQQNSLSLLKDSLSLLKDSLKHRPKENWRGQWVYNAKAKNSTSAVPQKVQTVSTTLELSCHSPDWRFLMGKEVCQVVLYSWWLHCPKA